MNTLVVPVPGLRPAWRWPLAVWLALVAAVLLVYRETALGMVDTWGRSETFTHAFLVPPIVIWLAWRSRDRLQPLLPQPVPWLLLPMAGLAALWWVGRLASVQAAMHLALAGMLVVSVPAMLGWQVARVLAFPLGFFFFAVPIGEFLTPLLMELTADFVVGAVGAVGVPVYREGQQLVIPSGRWAVVEACSGIRYLMASFMVGSLFAYLNYRSLKRRLIFVGLSLLVPILANWLRAFIIVMLGHLSNNRIATGVDHLVYGWVFFGVVIMSLFYIGSKWAEPDRPPADATLLTPAPVPAGVARYVVAALALLLALQWPAWMPRPIEAASGPLRLALPQAFGDWRAVDPNPLDWTPSYSTATEMTSRTYRRGGEQATLVLAYYRGHRDAGRLVSSVNALTQTEAGIWNQINRPLREASGTRWRNALLLGNEHADSAQRQRLRVWQLLWIGGTLTTHDPSAKLHQAWRAMRGERADSAAIFLVAPEPADVQLGAQALSPGERSLDAFAQVALAPLQQWLQQLAHAQAPAPASRTP